VLQTERKKTRLQEDTRRKKTQEAEEKVSVTVYPTHCAARGLNSNHFSFPTSTMASAELYQFYFIDQAQNEQYLNKRKTYHIQI
jgi:hypothetical protein